MSWRQEARKRCLRDRHLYDLVATVCREHSVSVAAVLAADRHAAVSRARKHCWWLLRERGLSYPDIARLFGRHHTTVIAALKSLPAPLPALPPGTEAGPHIAWTSVRVRCVRCPATARVVAGSAWAYVAEMPSPWVLVLDGEGQVAFACGRACASDHHAHAGEDA